MWEATCRCSGLFLPAFPQPARTHGRSIRNKDWCPISGRSCGQMWEATARCSGFVLAPPSRNLLAPTDAPSATKYWCPYLAGSCAGCGKQPAAAQGLFLPRLPATSSHPRTLHPQQSIGAPYLAGSCGQMWEATCPLLRFVLAPPSRNLLAPTDAPSATKYWCPISGRFLWPDVGSNCPLLRFVLAPLPAMEVFVIGPGAAAGLPCGARSPLCSALHTVATTTSFRHSSKPPVRSP